MRFRIFPLLMAFAAIILAVSCSDDSPNEPTPNPAAPTLEIEVLTPTPEIGQPVEFRATVTGATLTAPEYTWDFGDGETASVNTTQTSHIYITVGSYDVIVTVTDTVQSVVLKDTVSITVQPGDVSLILSVQTSNPGVGRPVEFKTDYSGPALSVPKYLWDFGDGGRDTTTTGIVQHEYMHDGRYNVRVKLLDSITGISAIDSTQITVTGNSPTWLDWNWVEITIRVPARFRAVIHGMQYPNGKDSVYVTDTNFVISTHFDHTRYENKRTWTGNRFSFVGYKGVGGEISGWFDQVEFDVWLGVNGQSIDSLYARKRYWLKDGSLTFDWRTGIRAAEVPAEVVTADSGRYALRGEIDCRNIQELEYRYEDRGTNQVIQTVEEYLESSQMYIEVRFYKK